MTQRQRFRPRGGDGGGRRMSGTVTWVIDQTYSGDWSAASHWSPQTVPGAADTVAIGPGLTAGPTIAVTATDEAAAAVLIETEPIAAPPGALAVTLAVAGSFAVGGLLNVAGGTLLAAGAAVTLGSLEEAGGLFVPALVAASAGASLAVGGTVIQQAGGTLSLAAATLTAPAATLEGTATLGAGADAAIGGVLSLGLEATTLDPTLVSGAGTLALSGGSTLAAATLDLLADSRLSLDATSGLVVGGAGFTAGAVAVAAGRTLLAPSGTIAGNLVLEGVLDASFPFAGYADPGTGLTIEGTLGGAGSIDVPSDPGTPGRIVLGSATGFTGRVDLGAGTDLVLLAGDLAAAPLLFLDATLDLRGQTYDAAVEPSYDAPSGLLTIGASTLDVGTGLSAGWFAVTADPAGGTAVTEAIPCYAAGTRILCEDGERPVELLRPGDRVVTARGRVAPVRWVGWRSIDLDRGPAPHPAAPIRVRAEALGPGRPRRDLRVSPDHALLLGGRLVPARLLCNGATIAREATGGRISYVHVELDRHDVLLAEGVAAESYLDTGNRAQFAVAAGERALTSDHAAPPAHRACALHARLLRRAEALGWRLTPWPDLRITVEAPGVLRLVSRVFVPDALDPRAGDGRLLGVAVVVGGDAGPLAPASFAEGWHPAEPRCDWRWTDGDARLRLPPGPAAAARITVTPVAAGARYWLAPDEAAAPNRAA